MAKVRNTCFAIALFVSIGFGFLKQAKTVCRSWDSMVSPHREPGQAYQILKEKSGSLQKPGVKNAGFFSYLSDRRDETSARPAVQYYYDFQYAMAPLLVRYQESYADTYFLDFSSDEDLENFCRLHGLTVVFRKGALGIAKKASAIP